MSGFSIGLPQAVVKVCYRVVRFLAVARGRQGNDGTVVLDRRGSARIGSVQRVLIAPADKPSSR
jgi:hypothetical protein